MGSATSVVVRQPHVQDSQFKQLLSSMEERKKLFDEISAFKVDDHITLKGKISFKKMLAYFSDPSHALYPGFDINGDIVAEAYKYVLKDSAKRKSKKKKKQSATANEQLSLLDFHRFLPVLLLFDRLWDIFDAADRVVIEDKRVFKGEFMGIYDRLHSLSEVVILGSLSKEQWEQEFHSLDKNNDGYINFGEFCNYCVTHIERPFDFNSVEHAESADDEDGADSLEEVGKDGVLLLQGAASPRGESATEEGDADAPAETTAAAAADAAPSAEVEAQ